MYFDDIRNENEQETLIQAIRTHNQDIGIAFGLEKCVMLILKI